MLSSAMTARSVLGTSWPCLVPSFLGFVRGEYSSLFYVSFKAVLRERIPTVIPLEKTFEGQAMETAGTLFGINNKGEGATKEGFLSFLMHFP